MHHYLRHPVFYNEGVTKKAVKGTVKKQQKESAKKLTAAFLSTHLLFLKYERTAITVHITVATQVTKAITISQVIRKPPLSNISA